MGFVTPPDLAISPLPFTITNEQINSVPLLLGVMEDMGIRTLLATHVTPHGAWQGASVGTVVSVWLCHILAERGDRLVAVRDWVAERTQTFNTLLDLTLRDTDCTDDRLANVLTLEARDFSRLKSRNLHIRRSLCATRPALPACCGCRAWQCGS